MTMNQTKDFFITYNKADRSWAEWISWHLEQAGYSTVFQDRDFPPGSNFVLEMYRAAAETKRTIAVLSPEYLEAEYTQSEWAAAFVKDPTGKKRKLVPVRVSDCNPQSLLEAIVYIDLVGLQELAARNLLLARVQEENGGPIARPAYPPALQQSATQKPSYPGESHPRSVPHIRNLNFTGRQNLLSDLRSAFTSEQSASIQVLHGLGGVGKTQTAIEYAYRYATEYHTVWWVRSEDAETLAADYAKLAGELDLPEKDTRERNDISRPKQNANVHAVRNWLARSSGWLLIFDNVREPADIYDYLPQGSTGHIIVTSRHTQWHGVADARSVEGLQLNDAVKFLLKRTKQNDSETAEKIANALGCLPLALEQAGAYIQETGRTLSYYLELLRDHLSKLMGRKPFITDYQATVTTTWNISFQQVKQTSPVGEELMNLCAFFAPDAMPRKIISDGKKFLPEPLATAVANPLEFDESVATLGRYSLAEVGNNATSFNLLVQAVLRERLNADAKKQWAKAAVCIVDAAFPPVDDKNERSTYETLLPHALATTTYAGDLKVAELETSRLLNQLGLYLQGRGEFARAKLALEKALAIAEVIYGPDDPRVAIHLNNLGGVLQDLDDLTGALKLYQRALKIDEAKLPPHDAKFAVRFNNLGDVLRELGDLEGALMYLKRALEIDENMYNHDHPKVARRVSNLGVVLYAQGDLSEARTHFERALKINKAAYGDSHRSVARDLNNLGNVLRDQGDITGARENYEHALKLFSWLIGEEHPSTVKAKDNLASLDEERDGDHENNVQV